MTLDTIPAFVPDEIRAEMAIAGAAIDRLAKTGHALHFAIDASTEELTVEVHHLRGHVLATIPAATALDIATGHELPEHA